eukprot:715862-Ditylum_brightwellii.AAC.1
MGFLGGRWRCRKLSWMQGKTLWVLGMSQTGVRVMQLRSDLIWRCMPWPFTPMCEVCNTPCRCRICGVGWVCVGCVIANGECSGALVGGCGRSSKVRVCPCGLVD